MVDRVADAFDYDVVIAGGGLTGASLAIALGQIQPALKVLLVESYPLQQRRENPGANAHFDARSIALSHGSRLIFEQLGVWPTLAPYCTPIRQVHVSDRSHIGSTRIDAASEGVEALGYVIENPAFGPLMLQHVLQQPGLDTLSPARVDRAQPIVGGMALTIERDGEPTSALRTRLLLVADGEQSSLRQSLGIEVERHDYEQTAIVANVGLSGSHYGVAYERFTAQGPIALLPLTELDPAGSGIAAGRDQRCALVWTLPPEQVDAVMALDDSAFLQRLQSYYGPRAGQLVKVGKRIAFPLARSLATEQVRSGLVVMGNAAHFLHPVAGQGFNLSLRDIACLADCLADGLAKGQSPGDLAVLCRYQERQQLDQKKTIGISDGLPRLFSNSNLPLAAARNAGLLGMEVVPAAKQWFARQAMGVAGRRPSLIGNKG